MNKKNPEYFLKHSRKKPKHTYIDMYINVHIYLQIPVYNT